MSLCERNFARNGLQAGERRLTDWSEWRDEAHYDWIVGSDVLYAERAHADLERVLAGNLSPQGRALLADPLRRTGLSLLERLESRGWRVQFTTWRLGDGTAGRAVALYDLCPPGALIAGG